MTEQNTSIAIDNDALKYMLSLPQGRAVVWDLLAAYGLFRNAFSADPSDRDFKLGMHNAALILYVECMTVSPDLTALMLREQGNYDNAAGTDSADADKRNAPGTDDTASLGYGRGHATDLGG